MSERPAEPQQSLESAAMHAAAVPFKDRDFRAAARVTPGRSTKTPSNKVSSAAAVSEEETTSSSKPTAAKQTTDEAVAAEMIATDIRSPHAGPQTASTAEVPSVKSVPAAPEAVSNAADEPEQSPIVKTRSDVAERPDAASDDDRSTRAPDPSLEISTSESAKVDHEETAEGFASDESVSADTVQPAADHEFAGLSLNEYVLKAVIDGGYERPTPIQTEIIPLVLAGRDVLAQSQTGSGKTAAFALPILSQIDTGKGASRRPQVLVLAPTRELAIQVSSSFQTYGAFLPGFTVTTIYGGQSYDSQFRQLKRGVNVVVGTPGRIIDHINRGTLDLSTLRCLVLDEADEMLNMGFLDDVRFVLERIPAERQIALFSATLPAPIRTIAEQYLRNPARVTIEQKTRTADSIRQRALFVAPRHKIDALKRVLEAEETDGVIVFTKTREATTTVADQLRQEGLATVALNGDMPQRVRERTIEQLKAGQLDILVATDVAARGLDVPRVSHVINYDAPHDNDSYIHRVGRTGRAGRTGEAIIFLSRSQRGRLKQIERATRQPIEIIDLPTADQINATRTKRLLQQITDTSDNQDLAVFETMIKRFAEESGTSMLRIAAALAHLGQQGRPFLAEELPATRQNHRNAGDNDGRRSRSFEKNHTPRRDDSQPRPLEAGMDRFRIAVGWQDGVKPGNIVGAVANEGGIDGDAIGAIQIYSTWSTIDLPQGIPDHVRQTLQKTRVAGRPLQLRPYTEEPGPAQRGHNRTGSGSQDRRKGPAGQSRAGSRFPGKRPFGRKFKGNGKPKGKAPTDNRHDRSGGSA